MKKKTDKDILFERFEKVDPTFKRRINEEQAPIEPDENGEEEFTVEPQEHDEEGASYKAKLECIVDKAQNIYEGLPEGELPSWVQDKITIAEEHLKSIYGWIHGEEEEQEGDIEGPNREMDSEELSEEDYRNTRYENMTQKQRQRYWDEKISNIMAANTLEDVIQAYSPENPLKITQKEVNKRFGGLGKFKKRLIDDIKQKGTFKGAFATDDD